MLLSRPRISRPVITGSDGVVGSELSKLFPGALCIDKNSPDPVDLNDHEHTTYRIMKYDPDIIFHMAAATDVDWCERNKDLCMKINVDATANLCAIAKELKIPIVYASTFFVYGGGKGTPYSDIDDIPNEEAIDNIYTVSKYLGEKRVRRNEKFYILRFGAMFGGGKKDKKFVRKILDAAKVKDTIDVVADRTVSLSYSKDLAKNMSLLVSSGKYGIYNMVNQGSVNYFKYASKLLEFADLKNKLNPIVDDSFSEDAKRGKYLAVCNDRLKAIGLDIMPHWLISLRNYVTDLTINGEL